MTQLFQPLRKYDLGEIATISGYKPTFAGNGRFAAVVSPDNVQYDFVCYPFASGDGWVLIAVDGEMPTLSYYAIQEMWEGARD